VIVPPPASVTLRDLEAGLGCPVVPVNVAELGDTARADEPTTSRSTLKVFGELLATGEVSSTTAR
jgi:hypothetical protein